MFIFNFKINGGRALKIIILVLSLFMLFVFGISIYKIFFTSGKFNVNDKLKAKNITELDAKNYTNILQAVHDDIDSYEGMKIKFTGYVYRVFDFSDEQFVIARDMFINEDKNQSVVVGFLCESKDVKGFKDGEWVEIIGTIEKGKYHNSEIPVIKITEIKSTTQPDMPYVMPPSDTYIPTSGLL